jgi:hypothetical protein
VLTDALMALASAGSTALVTAMVTDGWEGMRSRFARLLGRGDTTATRNADAWLEQSQATLSAVSGAEQDRVRIEQEIVWRTRLADLLEQDSHAAGELRTLVADVRALAVGAGVWVEQRAVAYDQAQQAVLGQGIQTNTFGRPYPTDVSQQ